MEFGKVVEFFKKHDVPIIGGNLEEVVDDFGMLTENHGEINIDELADFLMNSKKLKKPITRAMVVELLTQLQNLYINIYNKLDGKGEELKITPLRIEDGKPIIDEGTVVHRCIAKLPILKFLSVGGVLASEWIGRYESEFEGRFCAFAYRTLDETQIDVANKTYKGKPMPLNGIRLKNSTVNTRPYICSLIFDKNNPIMQELLKLDYFEYEHIKKTDPEKLKELYKPEIIDLFDLLIEPLSPAGKSMHDTDTTPHYDWLAIPAGIPPQLVVGIQINSNNQEMIQNIDRISEFFPNAVIFDENRNILNITSTTIKNV